MLLLVLIGCIRDQGLYVSSGETAPDDTAVPAEESPSEDTDDDGGSGGGGGGGGSGGSGSGSGSGGSGQDDAPRPPRAGELVISELMINPSGSADETGEWVELYNAADDTLDLSGLALGDDGVDDAEIDFSDTLIAPGDVIVLCASAESNGGVYCAGTYLYQTFGGGFALSNSEDEVIVLGADGDPIDTFRYSDGLAPAGQSVGVAPSCLDATSNDATSCWCAQSGTLSSGDEGNPGESNHGC